MSHRGSALFVATILLVVAPVVLLGWMRIRVEDQLTDLQPLPQPVVAVVAETVADDAQSVVVALVWGETPTVVAPAWSGVTTGVSVTPGDSLATGDVVVAVDGIDRIAAVTDFPFWRSLSARAQGDDVAQLQGLLASLGHYTGSVDGVFGASLTAAVNAFGSELGAVTPRGVFDPAWVIWLPNEQFELEDVAMAVGDPAPGAGTAVLFGPPRIAEVSLLDPEDSRLVVLPGDWELEIVGETMSLVDGGLTDEMLGQLSELVISEETELSGRVRRSDRDSVIEIPATAVTSNASGLLCAWIPKGSDFSPQAIEVEGGGFGLVRVVEGLFPGDEILVNPGEILGTPGCP